MTKDEALKQALEALEHAAYCVQRYYLTDKMGHDGDDTITAIKEALAQRTWVAIDDEDYIKAFELCDFDKDVAFEFFEAALKAKNT